MDGKETCPPLVQDDWWEAEDGKGQYFKGTEEGSIKCVIMEYGWERKEENVSVLRYIIWTMFFE